MNTRFACIGLIVALTAPALCLGATISYPSSTPIPSTKTDWSDTLAFPQFDPSLGTLISVRLQISTAFDTVLTVTNNASSESSGWTKTELILTVQDTGHNLVDPLFDLYTGEVSFTLAPGDQMTSGIIHKTGSSDDTYFDADVLAAFTGTGTTTLDAATRTFAIISYTGGNTDAVQSTYASATGSVTYNYETPEPATLLLMAIGCLFHRRRTA